ncbi:hypothetical protein C0Z18_22520 [Trinickia dabaoshanensis]|uniref:Uncharacterized protein n=1 Tax=Trinickia dabaoshanensis TaxID=564714 RepID=A0A2N7VHU5_9BURK|nr:hypothetical protein [Trinickia dabaoshanensis]PMS16722.1 hypothetical protein C0Z18_22520 [Trinickia dabaoshanensis]
MHLPLFLFRARERGASLPAALESPDPNDTLDAQLRNECDAMARFALRHGLPVAPESIADLARLISADTPSPAPAADEPDARHRLAALHGKLAAVIAPATPHAVLLLDSHYRKAHPLAWLGPVPLIRLLSIAAIAFLVAVIATGLSPDVSAKNIEQGFLTASGTSLLWNTLFLIFCAGLGASFAALFQAHRYIADATYDPRYDASYGARLILGVIAGLILVEMLPRDLFDSGGMRSFGKPALAMLGGFSATAVHRLLQRLVDTLDALVKGDPAAGIAAMRSAERAQTAQTRAQMQSEIAASLVELQQALDDTASTDDVKRRLAALTRTMLGAEPIRGGAARSNPSSPVEAKAR